MSLYSVLTVAGTASLAFGGTYNTKDRLSYSEDKHDYPSKRWASDKYDSDRPSGYGHAYGYDPYERTYGKAYSYDPYERTYGKAYSMHKDDNDKHYDDGNDYRSSKQWKRPSYSSKDSKGWKKDSDKYGKAYSYDPYERTYGKAYSMHKDEPKGNWKKSDYSSRDWKKNDGKYSSKDEPKGYKGYSFKDEPKGHKYGSKYSSKDEPKHEPSKHEPKGHKPSKSTTDHPTHSTTSKPTTTTAYPTYILTAQTDYSYKDEPKHEPNKHKDYSSKDEPKDHKDNMKPKHDEQPKDYKKSSKDYDNNKHDGKSGTAYSMLTPETENSSCPSDDDFDMNAPCDYEGTCGFGEETCCGETFVSLKCQCAGTRSFCYYTDACYGAQC